MSASAELSLVIGVKDKATGPLKKIAGGLGTISKASLALAGGGILALGAGLAGAASAGLGFNNSMEQATAKINAFTKDGQKTADILEMVRLRAAKTPFAFEEMANAAAALGPTSRSTGLALEDLIGKAEILAASNPAEGLEGAVFALKEAAGGDFLSVIERFNLPKQRLMELKKEGVPAIEAVTIAMREMGYDADLVSNMANTAAGRWSTLMDTFTTLASKITAPIFAGVSQGMSDLQVLLDANMPKIEAFAVALGDRVGNVMSWLATTAIPGLVTAFSTVSGAVSAVVSAFNENGLAGVFDLILPKLQAFGSSVLTWIGEQAPIWAAQILTWGQAFVGWIVPYIPIVLTELGGLVTSMGTWIVEQVPVILEKIGLWGVALTAWILPKTVDLLTNLGEFAGKLYTWIAEQVPVLIENAKAWGPPLTDWIKNVAMPALEPAWTEFENAINAEMAATETAVREGAVKLGTSLIDGFKSKLPGWKEELVSWKNELISSIQGWIIAADPDIGILAMSIILGFTEARPKLRPELDEWSGVFGGWLTEAQEKWVLDAALAGGKFATAIGQGMIDFTEEVNSAVSSIFTTAIVEAGTWVQSFVMVGSDIVAGIAAGIGAGAVKVAAEAIAAVTGALAAAKNAILARSPSRRFRDDVGRPMMQGVEEGILDEAPKVMDTMDKVIRGVTSAATNSLAEWQRTRNAEWAAYQAAMGVGPTREGPTRRRGATETAADEIRRNTGRITNATRRVMEETADVIKGSRPALHRAVDEALGDIPKRMETGVIRPIRDGLNEVGRIIAEGPTHGGRPTHRGDTASQLQDTFDEIQVPFVEGMNTMLRNVGSLAILPWLNATGDVFAITGSEWASKLGSALDSGLSAQVGSAYMHGQQIALALQAGLNSVSVTMPGVTGNDRGQPSGKRNLQAALASEGVTVW